MDLHPSRISPQDPNKPKTEQPAAEMATLTMRFPSSMFPSESQSMNRQPLAMPPRPRSGTERIELPSIRQAVPEINLISNQGALDYRADTSSYSPGQELQEPRRDSVSSSFLNKRRRLSTDDDRVPENQEYTASRVWKSPRQAHQHTSSSPGRKSSIYSASEYSNPSPYEASRSLHTVRSPPVFEATTRTEFRPTLPSLTSLTTGRDASNVPRARSNWSEYALDASRPVAQAYPQGSNTNYERAPSANNYPNNTYSYGYQQPRGQSYSGPSHPTHSQQDRSPFSSSTYHSGSHEPYLHDLGLSGVPEVLSKQRKRRGNLPKETTDKLRAWFIAHLQHPYPTEDEKQELMRQTGLQMNQISNWFINARRRQLPQMVNNARAETDARSARSGDSLVPDTEVTSLGSGSEGGYEDDFEGLESSREGSRPRAGVKCETE